MKTTIVIGLIVIMQTSHSLGAVAEYLHPDLVPDRFVSVEELKAKVWVDDGKWKTYLVGGTKFMLSRTTLPSAGSSTERIACWRLLSASGSDVVCVWKVRLSGLGVVDVNFDEKTSTLSVIPQSNTQ